MTQAAVLFLLLLSLPYSHFPALSGNTELIGVFSFCFHHLIFILFQGALSCMTAINRESYRNNRCVRFQRKLQNMMLLCSVKSLPCVNFDLILYSSQLPLCLLLCVLCTSITALKTLSCSPQDLQDSFYFTRYLPRH